MSDDFIRKDVYEAQFSAHEERTRREVDSLKNAFKLHRSKYKADVDSLLDAVAESQRRMDDLKDYVTWGFTVLGLSITVVGLVVSLVQVFAK